MRKFMTFAMMFSLVAFFGGDLLAQGWGGGPGRGRGRGPGDGSGFERFKESRAKLLREKVGLTEETAAKVEMIMDESHTKRRALRDDMDAQMKVLEELLEADSNDQKAYLAAITEVQRIQQELNGLREAEIDSIAQILTPKEQAKMIVEMKAIHSKVRRHMKKKFMRKGPRDGSGPRGGSPDCPNSDQ